MPFLRQSRGHVDWIPHPDPRRKCRSSWPLPESITGVLMVSGWLAIRTKGSKVTTTSPTSRLPVIQEQSGQSICTTWRPLGQVESVADRGRFK